MEATGIIRRIDELGRIAIPKIIRNQAGITEGDALEISFSYGKIHLEPYVPEQTLSFQKVKKDWNNMSKQERNDLITSLMHHIDD